MTPTGAAARWMYVKLRCSQCHTEFERSAADQPEMGQSVHDRCPTCNAEAGLEPIKAVPPAMRAFGALLGAAVVLAVAGDLVSRIAG